jgi:Bacterial PH domain
MLYVWQSTDNCDVPLTPRSGHQPAASFRAIGGVICGLTKSWKDITLSYVSKTLISGETILHEASISLWTQTPLILLGVVLTPAFGIGLIFLAMAYIRYKSTELAVTNKRTVAKFGFISRHTMEMNLSKIETIQVTQSLFGRMFDCGSLIISGAGIPQEPIPGIGQPMEFRRVVMEAQHNSTAR